VIVEELGHPFDQGELGHVRQCYPGGLGGIVAGHGITVVDDGDEEVEYDEVVAITDALDPAQKGVADGLEARLFPQLPHDGLGEGLPGLDPASGHRPLALGGTSPSPDEQDVVVGHRYGSDAQLGSRRRR